jgi:hypothetical protein
LTAGGLKVWLFFTEDWRGSDPAGLDDNRYCASWLGETALATLVSAASSSSMIVLNAVIAGLFAWLGKFKKKHTTIEEQSTGFS